MWSSGGRDHEYPGFLSLRNTTDKNRPILSTISTDKNISCVIKNWPIFVRFFVAWQKSTDKKSFQTWLKTKICRWKYWPVIGQRRCLQDGDQMKKEAILKLIELYEKHPTLCYCLSVSMNNVRGWICSMNKNCCKQQITVNCNVMHCNIIVFLGFWVTDPKSDV